MSPGVVHLTDTAYVPGILGVRGDRYTTAYTPMPLGWGEVCDRCWMRDQQVRPLSSGLCPHGGGCGS